MFIKKSFVEEIANSMERQLVDGAINKQAEREERLIKAADYLNAAGEIFDESGMSVHSEMVTAMIESLAASKNKKSKKNPKHVTKKPLTSERMISNLKEKGWVFDESSAHDMSCVDDNCATCGDTSYANDDSKQWWHLFHPESGSFSNILATPAQAAKHLDLKNKHIYPGWKLNGPFKTILELEKKHHPELFKNENINRDGFEDDKSNANDEDLSDELYSMLDDFKSNSNDLDFEDELDFDGFDKRNPTSF